MSANYEFVVQRAASVCAPPARLLDFGCGAGEIVSLALEAGYDAWGVDTFQGVWRQFVDGATSLLGERLRRAAPGEPLPFGTGSFDIAVSNQVFEHIPHITPAAAEIARVLHPRGQLLAVFPTREVIIEPHLRAPFVHQLPLGSQAQRIALRLSLALGLTSSPQASADEWVAGATHDLRHNIFYLPARDVAGAFAPWFQVKARMEPQWVRHRLGRSALSRLSRLSVNSAVLDSMLRFLCLRFANGVFLFERTDADVTGPVGRGAEGNRSSTPTRVPSDVWTSPPASARMTVPTICVPV
jgi:SAM-dependent methyltransferase